MNKLVGRVRGIDFNTLRYCLTCEATVKKKNDSWYCPNCGLIHWRKTRRVYFLRLCLGVFDTQVVCLARDHVMDKFLIPVGLSFRKLADSLSCLQGTAWTLKLRDIRKMVRQRLWQKYGEQVIKVYGEWYHDHGFLITRIKHVKLEGGKKFIEGSQRELLEITRRVLSDHKEKLEPWKGIPILRYTKNIRGETVEIEIRTPVAEYSKAYRVRVRVNGVHMIPTTPVYVGGPRRVPAYVYRKYHSKNWKENLTEILKYCVNKEDFLVNVVKASKTLYEGNETLWNLVNRVSKYDRDAAIRILQRHGLLQNEFRR